MFATINSDKNKTCSEHCHKINKATKIIENKDEMQENKS